MHDPEVSVLIYLSMLLFNPVDFSLAVVPFSGDWLSPVFCILVYHLLLEFLHAFNISQSLSSEHFLAPTFVMVSLCFQNKALSLHASSC